MSNESKGLTFPVEVWRAIFEQHVLHQKDLAALMRVCRSFTPHAKSFLYRALVLRSPTQARALFAIIRRFPELAFAVKWLTINVVTMWDDFRIPFFVPSLFNTLVNVQYFTLGFYMSPTEPQGALGDLLRMDPKLHVSPSNYAHVSGLPEYTSPAVPFPSLRVLSCRPFLLLHTVSGAISLTHLDLPYCNEDGFCTVAEVLGSQLVSLRISKVRFVGEPWSSSALLVKLSALRFLHIDMEPERPYAPEGRMPYLNTKPFNWYEAPDSLPSEPRHGQLRVVWAYPEETEPKAGANRWREFLYWTSLQVLKNWNLFFSTIEFRHPVLWGVRMDNYTSTLTRMHRRSGVQNIELEGKGDYWYKTRSKRWRRYGSDIRNIGETGGVQQRV
ncbi:hypothetical protein C8T65DRAFT_695377 [Cerioporus squamosus]|nr:hypothetical protein C8T65DRAFT_695377 [Cerioporus squamosus]